MVDIVQNILTPIVEISIIGSIVIFFGIIIYRAVSKMWKTEYKWVWKYKIRKKEYDEKDIAWIIKSIDNDVGYWNTKKFLMLRNVSDERVNEVMWLYVKIYKELKGGIKNGQRIARSDKQIKIETTELPTDFQTT